jgi:pyruvate,orthophosphate dikinase
VTSTYALGEPRGLSEAEARALLGGKAANLGVMARDLGLPVPPAFVITTEACRRFLADGWPPDLDDELRDRMRGLEALLGRRFGDPADPLLVSVRSGAPVSMPGMMDTILDLGLSDATTAGLARVTGDEAFARSCRERFESSFRSIVGVADVPPDPWAQLRLAIEAVFRSWQSDRARTYRRKEGIPDDLGTAVTVQAMVFGNRGPDSATGVLFTRDPATGEPALYGDVLFGAQGEDVVAGTHRTEPISVLDDRLPAVATELRAAATRLERHFRDLCDIEFTIESGRLWLLQVRVGKRSPAAAMRIAVEMAEDPSFPLTRAEAVDRVRSLLSDPPTTTSARTASVPPLLVGLPASPGMASGGIATTPQAAQAAAAGGTRAILVRAETSPDDVHGMAVAAGILTSRGGLASHAAVVARGWGIPAVVGATGLAVSEASVTFGDRTLVPGDVITIDGRTGEVFEGTVAGTTEVVPEVRTLLGWAADFGIDVAPPPSAPEPLGPGETGPDARPVAAGEVTADRCLQVIAIKGFAQATGIAEALLAAPTDVEPVLAELSTDGLIASSAGAFRLTDAGTARAFALLAADRAAWGAAAGAALDAFLEIDHRVKETVTAWQLRDAAAQVINDHTDPDYDAAVLDRLAAVDAGAQAWFTTVEAGPRRLSDYRARLSRALAQARAGDRRFVASPRVDSYHGIWFELHEDLIGLAGRTRAAEAEAGRA